MNPEPQIAASAAGRDPAGPPGGTAKGIVYGLLWLAIPIAALAIWVMAAASANPTGGCGGG